MPTLPGLQPCSQTHPYDPQRRKPALRPRCRRLGFSPRRQLRSRHRHSLRLDRKIERRAHWPGEPDFPRGRWTLGRRVVDHTLNTLSAWDLIDNQLYSFTATGIPNSVYYGVAEHAGLLVTLSDNPAGNVPRSLPAICCTSAVFDSKNNEWVANANGSVYLCANFGSFRQIITLSYNPGGMAVDEAHKLVYFSHNISNNLDVYTTAGKYVTTIN